MWRSRIFLSNAKNCAVTLLYLRGRQRAPVCRISSGSPGANRKLRDLSANGGVIRKSFDFARASSLTLSGFPCNFAPAPAGSTL